MNENKFKDILAPVVKRRFAWTLTADFPKIKIDETIVRLPSVPNDEEKTFKVSWIDDANKDTTKQLFALLADFFAFGSALFSDPESKLAHIKDSLGTIVVCRHDINGVVLETWTLFDAWPHSVNFGDLCYSSSEDLELEIEWGYGRCEHQEGGQNGNDTQSA